MALIFVGTYTEERAEGIFAFRLDSASGALTPLGSASAGPSPTWIVPHPAKPLLYAVNETGGETKPCGGAIVTLEIGHDGTPSRNVWSAAPTCGSFRLEPNASRTRHCWMNTINPRP